MRTAHAIQDSVGEDSPTEALLRAAESNQRARRGAEAQQLALAREWALEHRTRMYEVPADAPAGDRHERLLGASGLPVWEYAAAELAVAWEMHPQAAQRLMADAVDLHDRLPGVWAAVHSLELPAWVARKIVRACADLDGEAAREVDAQIGDVVRTLPPGRLLTVVAGRVAAADPDAADAHYERAHRQRMLHLSRETAEGTRNLFARCAAADAVRVYETCNQIAHLLHEGEPGSSMDQLRARALGILADPRAALELLAGRDPRRGKAVVHVHTTAEQIAAIEGHSVARVEDIGPATLRMLRDLLGHDRITLVPVIDLNDTVAADSYEIPARIRRRVRLIHPADTFPYAEGLGRVGDLDHVRRYRFGGPPGQTSVDNLAPLVRRHHRIKTHARGWAVEALPGHRYRWTSPHGRIRITGPHGTSRAPTPPVRRLDSSFPDFAVRCAC